jgi:hypothetical protein
MLPLGLHSTYERILYKITQQGKDVQAVVQRALQWLVLSKAPLTITALREVLAIRLDSIHFDPDEIPPESLLLRNCGSLVRRSADRTRLELAHFTVEQFLKGISTANELYSGFSISENIHSVDLAKQCLVYLTLEDSSTPSFDYNAHCKRSATHPFWSHAVLNWPRYIEPCHDDQGVLESAKGLFEPAHVLKLHSWARAFASDKVVEGQPGMADVDKVAAIDLFTP